MRSPLLHAVRPGAVGRLTPGIAYARALSGEECTVVGEDGSSHPLQALRWLEAADASDWQLFVAPCSGPTLDVGCGPGRLLVALQRQGVLSHGIDLSAAAIARARARGVAATCADVFSPMPGELPDEGHWSHVLLADGNVGIGGRPAQLLGRVRSLLATRGRAHVELAPGRWADAGVTTTRLRLRVGGDYSTSFRWATVGVDAIARLADNAGLRLLRLERHAGRRVAVLGRVG